MRELNEDVQKSYKSHPDSAYTDILCECGNADCDVFIQVTKADYEEKRADPRQFIIVRDHLAADVDELVSETDRFVVVRKREGQPAEMATETDPRG